MYKSFFGLTSEPFSISPDPKFLTLFPQTREALASLEYGISSRRGIVALTGEVGTGKTLLLRASLNALSGKPVHVAYVFNPRLDIVDFLEFVLLDFGVLPERSNKAALLMQLNRWLLEMYRQQETCVLVIDEAQDCSLELLEEIRLLTNLETSTEKLIQVVLSGQPELEAKLRLDKVRQLRQRIALWCRTYALNESETHTYIADRLHIAGARAEIFRPGALHRVYVLSEGIPRTINLLCEHALILAYVYQEQQIGPGIIDTVADDLMLSGSRDTNNADEQTVSTGTSSLPQAATSASLTDPAAKELKRAE